LRDHRKFCPHTTKRNLIAEVDLDLQENVRQNWPFFRDRRIDAFEITKERLTNLSSLKNLLKIILSRIFV
jgi:hypothetical protein